LIEQQYYTSTPKRLDGQAGLGVKAQSSGITPEEYALLGVFASYQKPLAVPDEDIERAPISLSFAGLASGHYVLSHVAYAGRDYSGRWGNFFAHGIVCEESDLDVLYRMPVSLMGQSFWMVREETPGNEVRPLASFPRLESPSPAVIAGFFSKDPRRPRILPDLLQAVFDAKRTGRRVVIIDDPTNVARWIYAVYSALPQSCRLGLSFSTYQRDPSAVAVDIVGLYPGESEVHLTGSAQFQYTVFSEGKSGDATLSVGLAADTLARLIICRDEVRLSQLHSLADTLGVQHLPDFEDVIALDMLINQGLGAVPDDVLSRSMGVFDPNRHLDPSGVGQVALDLVDVMDDSSAPQVFLTVLGLTRGACSRADQADEHDNLVARKALSAMSNAQSQWLGWLGEVERFSLSRPVLEELALAKRNVLSQLVRLSPDIWKTALAGPGASAQRSNDLWWMVNDGLQLGLQPEAEWWEAVRDQAARTGSTALFRKMAGSLIVFAEIDPRRAAAAIDSIGADLVAVAPDELIDATVSLVMPPESSTLEERRAAIRRCVDLVKPVPVFAPERLRRVLAPLAHQADELAIVCHDLFGDGGAIADAAVRIISGVQGNDGDYLRAVLASHEPYASLADAVVLCDARTHGQLTAFQMWLRSIGGLHGSSGSQMDAERAFSLIFPGGASPQMIDEIWAQIGRQNVPQALRQKLVITSLAAGPIAPIPDEDMVEVGDLDRVPPNRWNYRVHLSYNLTRLPEIAQDFRRPIWPQIATRIVPPRGIPIPPDEQKEYWRQVFGILSRARARPPTAAEVESPEFQSLMKREYLEMFLLAFGDFLSSVRGKENREYVPSTVQGLIWVICRYGDMDRSARFEIAHRVYRSVSADDRAVVNREIIKRYEYRGTEFDLDIRDLINRVLTAGRHKWSSGRDL
jgi:hypothetical protein